MSAVGFGEPPCMYTYCLLLFTLFLKNEPVQGFLTVHNFAQGTVVNSLLEFRLRNYDAVVAALNLLSVLYVFISSNVFFVI